MATEIRAEIICEKKLDLSNQYIGCLLLCSTDEPAHEAILNYLANNEDNLDFYTLYEGCLELYYCDDDFIEADKFYEKITKYPDKALIDSFFYTFLELINRKHGNNIKQFNLVYEIAKNYYSNKNSENKFKTLKNLLSDNFTIPANRLYLTQMTEKELLRHYFLLFHELCCVFGKTNDPENFWNWLKSF